MRRIRLWLTLVLLWLIMLAKREWASARFVWAAMWEKAPKLFDYSSGKASWRLWERMPQWLRNYWRHEARSMFQPAQSIKSGQTLAEYYASKAQPGDPMFDKFATTMNKQAAMMHAEFKTGRMGLDTPALAIACRVGSAELRARQAHLRGRDMLYECQGLDKNKMPWCAAVVAYERFLMSN